MREGVASVTAAHVAAYRLSFDRLPAPFGDPVADDRLAQDVSESVAFEPRERMARHLRYRTAFFDRVVVNALERDVIQVACVGAGYDGRCLRYAKPGVRWFEVDHPATQDDKLGRLRRLEMDASHVTFVALDLDRGGTRSALLAAGWNPDASSLLLCEGLVVYLSERSLVALLLDLRALTTAGTRLALSWPPALGDGREREQFRAAVAAIGEPAGNDLHGAQVARVLADAHWRLVDISERARRSGFAVAAPVWRPAATGAPPTASHIGRYLERLHHRRGVQGLPGHLADAYAIEVSELRQLDVGVFHVKRHDGVDWVARVLPAARPLAATRGDAGILELLRELEFPAERCAGPNPVTTYQRQAVVVTEYVPGAAVGDTSVQLGALGDLLGRLHASSGPPAAAMRPGGGWHHLVSQGGPADEVAACAALVDAAAARVPAPALARYELVRGALSSIELCAGLPQALIHPDFVPVNAIVPASGVPTLVDWTGAGRGPRLWSLAFLLWAAGPRRVASVISAYRRHVALEAAELERLSGAIAARPLLFSCWGFATGRERLADTVRRLAAIRTRATALAAEAVRICAA